MRERPILFSGPMVRAILAGTKTQTRRVAKDVRHPDLGNWYTPGALALEGEPQHVIERACPHGRPGDRLWVKETHLAWWTLNPADPEGPRVFSHVAAFAADGYELEPGERWIPSIHMRRAASRILLEVTGVRLERLNDISDGDCWAEGIEECDGTVDDGEICRMAKAMGRTFEDPQPTYAALWEQINGAGAWAANPWVWVIEFKRAEIGAKMQEG